MTRGARSPICVEQRGGLLRRGVGQAEDRQIDLCQQLALGLDILARLRGQAQQLDAGESRELLPDLQPGRSGFAVDEDFDGHVSLCAASRTKGRAGRRRARKYGVQRRRYCRAIMNQQCDRGATTSRETRNTKRGALQSGNHRRQVSQVHLFARAQRRHRLVGLSSHEGIPRGGALDENRLGELLAKGRDPAHAVFIYAQNFASVMAEEMSVLKELRQYARTVEKAEDEYIPSFPPMSPVTISYFTMWAFFDVLFGQSHETIGTCLQRLAREASFQGWLMDAINVMQNSRMGFYVHCGIEDRYVRLREIGGERSSVVTRPRVTTARKARYGLHG